MIRFFVLTLVANTHVANHIWQLAVSTFGIDLTHNVSSCPICTRRWHEIFLSVYHSSVVQFLEYLMQMGRLPQQLDYKKPISSLLVVSAFWKEAIFNCGAGDISRAHVDSLFLSLIALRMLQMKFWNSMLEWIVVHEYGCTANNCFIENHIGHPIYKRKDTWVGIHLFSKKHMHQRDVSLLIDNS